MRTHAVAVLLLLLPAAPARADRNEELLEAARKGDAKAVEALLAKGADVNAKSAYGATALSFAADKGHLDVVRVLIKHKADLNVNDTFYNATPMTWALMRGHAGVVKALVEAGASGAGSTLRAAAGQGKADVVKAILETDKVKGEALDKALAATPAGNKEVAELLRKAGARAPDKPAPAPVKVPAETLKEYAGTYRTDSGLSLTVNAEGGKLAAAFAGQPLGDLAAADDKTFRAGTDLSLTFQRTDGKVSGASLKRGAAETAFARTDAKASAPAPAAADPAGEVKAPLDWPQFRGPGASGVADGQLPPTVWDAGKGVNLRWKRPVPGLGHSCPVVWGDRVFVTTAVSGNPDATFRPGQYGDVDSVDDRTEHAWKVYCLDKRTGEVRWERTAARGVPKVKRHLKGSQANPTPATDGKVLVVSFGSEGLFAYDLDGKPLWKNDLGVLSSGWFYDKDYEWGFGSSPVLYRDRVLVQCDVGKNSFVAAHALADGKQLWRTPREEVPSWGTPTVVEAAGRVQLVTNASKFARGYDVETGKELWRLGRHSEITVPTPLFAHGLIFLADGYRPVQPIYAVRPTASGDITLKDGKKSSDAVVWSLTKGAPYMPTPIVYGDHLYVCSNGGMLTCYEAKTGKEVYRERLGGGGGYTASPVAADGRLYFTSEEHGVTVVKAGPKFERLAVNKVGEACMATPAISDGMIFVRGQHHLFAFGRAGSGKAAAKSAAR
jgi:outer membrane protein assembly factor BamB